MAISKIIYKSSPSAQGETWMDLTQDTVSDANHIRSSYIGHLNDGTSVIGTYKCTVEKQEAHRIIFARRCLPL